MDVQSYMLSNGSVSNNLEVMYWSKVVQFSRVLPIKKWSFPKFQYNITIFLLNATILLLFCWEINKIINS
jgi:hypothetical protein